jgi:hypothetical protein
MLPCLCESYEPCDLTPDLTPQSIGVEKTVSARASGGLGHAYLRYRAAMDFDV